MENVMMARVKNGELTRARRRDGGLRLHAGGTDCAEVDMAIFAQYIDCYR